MRDRRTRLFQWIANRYPTERVERSVALQALWRGLFAAVAPRGPIEIRTADYRIRIDPRRKHVGRSILHRCGYDRLTTDRFRAAVRPGMLVVDVGANIGHYALVAAAALRGTGEVRAYEPEPSAFGELDANVRLNGFPNVLTRRAAVSDRHGSSSFFVDAVNEGGHSLAERNTRAAGQRLEVPTVTLDEECAGREVGVLKIDAQGAEGAILLGAREVLSRGRPVVYLEFWPHGMRRCGSDPAEVLATIRSCGYRARVIDRRRGRIREADADELKEVAASDDRRTARNLLLERG